MIRRRRPSGRLVLYADYGAAGDSPVWSERGRLPFAELRITQALRDALVDWQAEGCDDDGTHPGGDRSEREWEQEGERLARWLSDATGLQVDLET